MKIFSKIVLVLLSLWGNTSCTYASAGNGRFDWYTQDFLGLSNTLEIANSNLPHYSFIIAFVLLALLMYSSFLTYNFHQQIEKQKKFNLLLKQRMVEQMKSLNKTNRELMVSNEELSQFNFIISHDLKEPLRSIVSFSSLALRKSKDSTITEYLQFIRQSGKQLNTLVEDIKDFKELNEFELSEDEVNLNELIDDIRMELQNMIEQSNARIKYPMLPTIICNEKPLKIILKNLIENGIKYNEEERPIVSVNYQQTPENHIFFIEDNGIGIEEQYFEKVFTLFKRLHNREDYDGSGLGMPVSKKLASKMNGDLFIFESVVGKGSIFQLILPKQGKDIQMEEYDLSSISN